MCKKKWIETGSRCLYWQVVVWLFCSVVVLSRCYMTFGGYDEFHLFLKKVVFNGECRILLCISGNPGWQETPVQPALAFIFQFFYTIVITEDCQLFQFVRDWDVIFNWFIFCASAWFLWHNWFRYVFRCNDTSGDTLISYDGIPFVLIFFSRVI